MIARRKQFFGSLAAASIVAAAGCGGGGGSRPAVSTSTTKAKVSGAVRLRGAPVGGGTIYFDPSNVERKMAGEVEATIGKDGNYSIETLIGMNRVRVVSPDLKSQETDRCDVKEGENTFNLDLQPRE